MSAINITKIKSLTEDWLKVDVNPKTRLEIETLLSNENYQELDKRLSDRILFGTAGLRSKMEAGFSRMNDVTVLQASQGLAKYIKEASSKSDLSIVVGHDHRHNSLRFAELTAAAFLHLGFTVYFLGPDVVPTPLVPFAIDNLHADGGVMVTASHNPAQDNGYKVYWANGCQIIPPHDSGIQKTILANLNPFFEAENNKDWNTKIVFDQFKEKLVYCKDEQMKLYLQAINEKLISPSSSLPMDFKFVYTPMHGVGYEPVSQLVTKLSSNGNFMNVVKEQQSPDPDFPTVKFPNPEEKGAMDLGMQTADTLGLDLVLSNDPDADRFSAAVKSSKTGEWRQLTGNEIGFLFADFVINRLVLQGKDLSKIYLLNSTVSSQMISTMAETMGFNYEDTLTGFKWIGNKAIELEQNGEGFSVPFAFEEAIGFMFSVVHDKDGVSALVVFLQMYAYWKSIGKNAIDVLEEGYQKFGFFKQCNGYYTIPDLKITEKIFTESIRTYYSKVNNTNNSNKFPERIGDEFTVVSWRDLTIGYDSTTSNNIPILPVDKSSQMITVSMKSKDYSELNKEIVRFTVRGSGTEPKLKVYIEARALTEEKSAKLAKLTWDTLKKEWFKPDLYNLKETV
ncbi:hypothetical protein BVG19_g3663 [[Candida] boidinii]|nr:hypothetical protein BVG19_g3663 [[Candida] boidinii]OWB52427.1 intramolecular transferase activity, phosphotransferases protein [[Candida] boidinii]OWB85116.1 intramolecular transferase activity, phosphotransferases protein [[Candida] boidinii]